MKQRYIVKTQGRVLDYQGKAYEIIARSPNEAVQIANEQFNEDYPVADNMIYSKAKNVSWLTILSGISLLIAVIPTFITWTSGHEKISLMPSLLSCGIAVAFYASYLVRFKGINNSLSNPREVYFFIMLVLLISSFVQALLTETKIKILFITIPIDTKTLLFVLIVLSWLGMRIVSAIGTVILLVLSYSNLVGLSGAMKGFFGPLYIIASFIGIVTYIATEPAFYEGILDFGNHAAKAAARFRDDLQSTANTAKEVSSTIMQNRLQSNGESKTENEQKNV